MIETQLQYSYNTIQFKTLTFSNEECCERATENIHKKIRNRKKNAVSSNSTYYINNDTKESKQKIMCEKSIC
jgi:hypothetical protein